MSMSTCPGTHRLVWKQTWVSQPHSQVSVDHQVQAVCLEYLKSKYSEMEIKRILKFLPVSFDELGLTDNKNPFGLISFLHPFIDLLSSGKWVNNKAKDDIIWPREGCSVLLCCRKKRSIADPKLDPESIHGGERAFLYQVNFITLPILCQYLTLSQSKVANIILPPGPRQISDFECVEEEKRQKR